MKRRTRNVVAALTATTALSAAAFGTSVAQAAAPSAGPEAVNAKVTGSLRSNTSTIELPQGSAFVGTVDYDTADFSGHLQMPDIDVNTTTDVGGNPTPVHIVLRVTDDGVDGTLDTGAPPEDGRTEAAASTHASVQVTKLEVNLGGSWLELPVGESCFLRPINLDLSGTYDPDAGEVALGAEGFNIPAAPEGSCGSMGGIDIASQLNDSLAGHDTAIELLIELGAAPEPPASTTTMTAAPTTTTSGTTPTAPTAPPAKPAPGKATYTG